MNKKRRFLIKSIGILLLFSIWISVKYLFRIEDRFLPGPVSVITAFSSIEPNVIIHAAFSILRLWAGFILGIFFGIFLGLILFRSNILYELFYPSIQSIRSIPPYATIPFFLLWFGFSEIGKFVILIIGISFNLAIASYQALNTIPEKFTIFFNSIQKNAKEHIRSFTIPYVTEHILPTLRFSLSTAIGLVVVAEMLGSQIGLGYLIQTSKSTFSLNVVLLAAVLFGFINYATDKILVTCWNKIVFWRH